MVRGLWGCAGAGDGGELQVALEGWFRGTQWGSRRLISSLYGSKTRRARQRGARAAVGDRQTVLMREPLPWNPAAETALRRPIRCLESLASHGSSSQEIYVFRRRQRSGSAPGTDRAAQRETLQPRTRIGTSGRSPAPSTPGSPPAPQGIWKLRNLEIRESENLGI